MHLVDGRVLEGQAELLPTGWLEVRAWQRTAAGRRDDRLYVFGPSMVAEVRYGRADGEVAGGR